MDLDLIIIVMEVLCTGHSIEYAFIRRVVVGFQSARRDVLFEAATKTDTRKWSNLLMNFHIDEWRISEEMRNYFNCVRIPFKIKIISLR